MLKQLIEQQNKEFKDNFYNEYNSDKGGLIYPNQTEEKIIKRVKEDKIDLIKAVVEMVEKEKQARRISYEERLGTEEEKNRQEFGSMYFQYAKLETINNLLQELKEIES